MNYSQTYYQANKERLKQKAKENYIKHQEERRLYRRNYYKTHGSMNDNLRMKRLKEEFAKMLGGKCEVCGYDKCIGCLDFHHLDPKDKENSTEYHKKSFKQKILEGKIQLLCCRCHRELHFERGCGRPRKDCG